VEVVGSVNYFNKRGDMNLTISSMKLCGDGEKLLKKKELIEKLYKLGYFDEDKKKLIPKFPKNVGVITSSTGAAIADITKNIFERTNLVEVLLFPCIVQGAEAKKSILKAIEKTKEYDLDVIIIGRGGGSKDDLGAFDDEDVAMALYNLKTPVISAVGHEIDKSVVDYIADRTVSTPTAAAIMAVPNDEDLLDFIEQSKESLEFYFKTQISNLSKEIQKYEQFSFFKDYTSYFVRLKKDIENNELLLNNYYKTTRNLLNREIEQKEVLLNNLNPQNLLEKGYAIIFDKNNKVIDSVEVLNKQESIYVQLKDGKVEYKGEK
jgi:exodeoxyribonuclease VII large subunit